MKGRLNVSVLSCLSVLICLSCESQSIIDRLADVEKKLENQRALIESINSNTNISDIIVGDGICTVLLSDGREIHLSNKTPVITIGANGSWIINGKDTGLSSHGRDAGDVDIGTNVNWFIAGRYRRRSDSRRWGRCSFDCFYRGVLLLLDF